MKKFLIAILSVSFLFLAIYHPVTNAFQPGDPEFNLVNIEGRYSMELPEYLYKGYDLNSDASLQYQNTSKEVYIIVIDESKQVFKDVFIEDHDFDTTKSILENYARVQMKSVRDNMSAVTKDSAERILKTGCGDARVYDIFGNVDGVDGELGYTLGFIEGRLNVYMIMTWTFRKDWPVYHQDMDRMIVSFRELSGDIDVEIDPYAPKIAVDVPEFMHAGYSDYNAALQYNSEKSDFRFAVYEKDIDYWDTKFKKRYNKDQSFLDFFAASTLSDYQNRMLGVKKMSSLSKSKINDMDAQTFTFTGKEHEDDRECFYKIVCVQGKKNLYIIQAWTPTSSKSKDEPDMDKMIKSFREL